MEGFQVKKDQGFVSKSVSLVRNLMKNKLIAALFMFISGLIFVITPDGTDMNGIARIIMGVVVGVALVGIITNLTAKDRKTGNIVAVILYAVALILGIILFINTGAAARILRVIFGITTLVAGATNIVETIRFHPDRDWKFYVCIVAAVLQAVLGIVMIVASVEFSSLVRRIAGGAMVFSGLVNMFVVYQIRSAAK